MDQLKKIISHLGVSCLLFVENDFVPVCDNKKRISKYLLLPAKCKSKLQEKLRELCKSEFVEQLLSFENKFKQLDHTVNKDVYLATGDIDSYLKTLNDIGDITNCIDDICAKMPKEIASLFFQYGVIESYPDQYKSLFDEFMKPNSEICILLYNNITPSDITEFERNLISTVGEGINAAFIAIIDNKLGSGDDEGVRIANEYIKSIIDNHKRMSGYSIVFTSQVPPNDCNDFGSGHFQIVSKSANPVSDISQAISMIAFSKTFGYIHNKMKDAVSNMPKLITKNKHSVAYIVDKANIEGMLPYEAISIWYENALNYGLNKAIADEKDTYLVASIGLAKIINVSDSSTNVTDSKMQEVCSNELFDYTINSKHLPLAPGDIFQTADNKYLILVGQTCDLSLRTSSLKRNAQIAELLNASFKSVSEIQKYYRKQVNGIGLNSEEKKEAWIKSSINRKIGRCDNFLLYNEFLKNTEKGFLKINYKTNNLTFVKFDILDLCMYNTDGDCKINTDENLDESLLRYLPDSNTENYKKLQTKIKSIRQIKTQSKIDTNIISDELYVLLDYKEDGNNIIFPYKRICRIKGNFNRLIHDNYWNYRSRIDLNEINLTNNEG